MVSVELGANLALRRLAIVVGVIIDDEQAGGGISVLQASPRVDRGGSVLGLLASVKRTVILRFEISGSVMLERLIVKKLVQIVVHHPHCPRPRLLRLRGQILINWRKRIIIHLISISSISFLLLLKKFSREHPRRLNVLKQSQFVRLLEKLVLQLDQIAALGFIQVLVLIEGDSVIVAASGLDEVRLVAAETHFNFLGVTNQLPLRGLLLV